MWSHGNHYFPFVPTSDILRVLKVLERRDVKRYLILLGFSVCSSTGAEIRSFEDQFEKFNQECLSSIEQKDSGLEKITRRLTGGSSKFAIKTCKTLALQKLKEQEYLSSTEAESDQLFRVRINALAESYPDILNFETNAQVEMLTIIGGNTREDASSDKPVIRTLPSFISLPK